MDDQEKLVREKAIEHARALGCTCNPDIEYKIDHSVPGGVMNLSIAHDDWCALVKDK